MPSPSENRAVDIVLDIFPGSTIISPDRTKPTVHEPIIVEMPPTMKEMAVREKRWKKEYLDSLKGRRPLKKGEAGEGQGSLL